MKYSIATLTLMSFVFLLPACFRDATVTGLPAAEEPALEDWRNHFLFGVVRGIKTEDVDLDEICPKGVARIETKQNGWQGLVSLLTLSIYTPHKLNIYCVDLPEAEAAAPAATAEEAPPAEAPAGEEAGERPTEEGAS